MDLLTLPYDIRHLIYDQVFPPGPQIYIHVLGSSLKSITPEHRVPTTLLRVNSQLHVEASEYLYNGYLFNLVGTKKDCITAYKPFLATIEKYSREAVRADVFSNGRHSATMCMSLQSGDAKLDFLKSRERGQPTTLMSLKEEVAAEDGMRFWGLGCGWRNTLSVRMLALTAIPAVVVMAVLSMWWRYWQSAMVIWALVLLPVSWLSLW